eukprot:scaffold58322_cov67-Phaeocystis_antarctica.AAC.8
MEFVDLSVRCVSCACTCAQQTGMCYARVLPCGFEPLALQPRHKYYLVYSLKPKLGCITAKARGKVSVTQLTANHRRHSYSCARARDSAK